MKILMIDNYDSFTYNLVHYLGELGACVDVARNDKISVHDAVSYECDAIVISPGPATPNETGICIDLVKEAVNNNIPLLGVCLGHQAIGAAYGADIIRTNIPVHGKCDNISHNGEGLFKNLKNPFIATRYHSLIIKNDTLPDCLSICASNKDGYIMGVKHKELPIYGVQFHPESIATKGGKDLLGNFLDIVKERMAS